MPPLFRAGLAPRSSKAMISTALRYIDGLGAVCAFQEWSSVDSFRGAHGMGKWHTQRMRSGAAPVLCHELWIDLAPGYEAIKSGLRKSYKSLINSGLKLWEVGVLDREDAGVWSEFRELHRIVAGRVTRSAARWDMQLRAIGRSAAFLVHLRDPDGRLVGGGFFCVSRDEGVYAVAAYDRNLFDKPIGHVVQAEAIQEMIKRGIKWYRIGFRPYPANQPAPTAKELAIAEFKEGFASHCLPCYLLQGPIRACT